MGLRLRVSFYLSVRTQLTSPRGVGYVHAPWLLLYTHCELLGSRWYTPSSFFEAILELGTP